MENKRRSRVLLIIVIILLLLLALLIWRQCSGSTDTTPDEPAFTATTTEEPSPTGATTGEPVPIEHTPTLSISSETPSLVGRWEGTLENNDFVVLIEGMIPSQQHVENIFLVSGCITFSDASNYSPMSGTAVLKEGAAYDIRWWGTMFGSPLETLLGLSESGVPIMLSGSVDSSLQGAEAQGECSQMGLWSRGIRHQESRLVRVGTFTKLNSYRYLMNS